MEHNSIFSTITSAGGGGGKVVINFPVFKMEDLVVVAAAAGQVLIDQAGSQEIHLQ